MPERLFAALLIGTALTFVAPVGSAAPRKKAAAQAQPRPTVVSFTYTPRTDSAAACLPVMVGDARGVRWVKRCPGATPDTPAPLDTRPIAPKLRATRGPRPAPADCERQPYWVDGNGIERLRRRCL